jgi:hypothetical protein
MVKHTLSRQVKELRGGYREEHFRTEVSQEIPLCGDCQRHLDMGTSLDNLIIAFSTNGALLRRLAKDPQPPGGVLKPVVSENRLRAMRALERKEAAAREAHAREERLRKAQEEVIARSGDPVPMSGSRSGRTPGTVRRRSSNGTP